MSIPSLDHESDLLTTAEVAQMLKVSPITIARWKKRGLLLAYKLGPRAVRYRRQDVAALAQPVVVAVADPDQDRLPAPRPPYQPYRHDPSVINHELLASLKPLTGEQVAKALAWLEEADELRDQIRTDRGGIPLPDSWPLIREAREER